MGPLLNLLIFITTCVIVLNSHSVCGQQRNLKFVDYFRGCNKRQSNFDNCVKDALNAVRPFFKTGVPEYNIPPFDPFYADEVVQIRGGNNLNYKLKLKNITESGWTLSQVTRFRSDFTKNLIQYTQSFPDKHLSGEYEFVGTMLGRKMYNKGHWNLSLYDLVQTTTITRKPVKMSSGKINYNTPLKVNVNVQTIKNLSLHISNLVRGINFVETILDRIINSTWEPGFVVTRPLINDLVSTAFTEIFNRSFKDFDFNILFP
ncbi:uncharacterized protein LOC123304999 [Chrysoperla carnea]|uniref:uncharacterized protein LOC123304999 n=1 Tax=Chrysoperla carnea TaxID=189513 RepID=UPI001D08DCD7|nr:uncharacterized protein LOC123304999 [Chrysoperla carnea]